MFQYPIQGTVCPSHMLKVGLGHLDIGLHPFRSAGASQVAASATASHKHGGWRSESIKILLH